MEKVSEQTGCKHAKKNVNTSPKTMDRRQETGGTNQGRVTQSQQEGKRTNGGRLNVTQDTRGTTFMIKEATMNQVMIRTTTQTPGRIDNSLVSTISLL